MNENYDQNQLENVPVKSTKEQIVKQLIMKHPVQHKANQDRLKNLYIQSYKAKDRNIVLTLDIDQSNNPSARLKPNLFDYNYMSQIRSSLSSTQSLSVESEFFINKFNEGEEKSVEQSSIAPSQIELQQIRETQNKEDNQTFNPQIAPKEQTKQESFHGRQNSISYQEEETAFIKKDVAIAETEIFQQQRLDSEPNKKISDVENSHEQLQLDVVENLVTIDKTQVIPQQNGISIANLNENIKEPDEKVKLNIQELKLQLKLDQLLTQERGLKYINILVNLTSLFKLLLHLLKDNNSINKIYQIIITAAQLLLLNLIQLMRRRKLIQNTECVESYLKSKEILYLQMLHLAFMISCLNEYVYVEEEILIDFLTVKVIQLITLFSYISLHNCSVLKSITQFIVFAIVIGLGRIISGQWYYAETDGLAIILTLFIVIMYLIVIAHSQTQLKINTEEAFQKIILYDKQRDLNENRMIQKLEKLQFHLSSQQAMNDNLSKMIKNEEQKRISLLQEIQEKVEPLKNLKTYKMSDQCSSNNISQLINIENQNQTGNLTQEKIKSLNKTQMFQKTLYTFMNKGQMLCRLSKIQIPKNKLSNPDIIQISSKTLDDFDWLNYKQKSRKWIKKQSKKQINQKQNVKKQYQRLINLELIKMSEMFFESVPCMANAFQSYGPIENQNIQKQQAFSAWIDSKENLSNIKVKAQSSVEGLTSQNIQIGSQKGNFNFSNSKSYKTTYNWLSKSQYGQVDTNNLHPYQIEALENKIFTPYLISNKTIISYEKTTLQEKLSIMDILQTYYMEMSTTNKLYFKVEIDENSNSQLSSITGKKQHSLIIRPEKKFKEAKQSAVKKLTMENVHGTIKADNIFGGITYSKERQMVSHDEAIYLPNKSIQNLQEADENKSEEEFEETNLFYNKQEQNNKQIKTKTMYFEFDIRAAKDLNNQDEMSDLTMLNIQDITQIINNQLRFCDKIYSQAIQQNYSHEQMGPLNSVVTNSLLVKWRVARHYSACEQVNKDTNFDLFIKENINENQIVSNLSYEARELYEKILNIEESAKQMYYYNTNQIYRMQISKNELKIVKTSCYNINIEIQKIIKAFLQQISSDHINVYLIKKNNLNSSNLISDWKIYQLILYNLIQNSVNYNRIHGDIVVVVELKKIKTKGEKSQMSDSINSGIEDILFKSNSQDEQLYILETIIFNNGQQICKSKQKQLFIPFKDVCNSISYSYKQGKGMGLQCSKLLSYKMNGDVALISSKKDLNVFGFKLPVRLKTQSENEKVHSLNPIIVKKRYLLTKLYGNDVRDVNYNIRQILKEKNIDLNNDIEMELSMQPNNNSVQQSFDNSNILQPRNILSQSSSTISLSKPRHYVQNQQFNLARNSKQSINVIMAMNNCNSKSRPNSHDLMFNNIFNVKPVSAKPNSTISFVNKMSLNSNIYWQNRNKSSDQFSFKAFRKNMKPSLSDSHFKMKNKFEPVEVIDPKKRSKSKNTQLQDFGQIIGRAKQENKPKLETKSSLKHQSNSFKKEFIKVRDLSNKEKQEHVKTHKDFQAQNEIINLNQCIPQSKRLARQIKSSRLSKLNTIQKLEIGKHMLINNHLNRVQREIKKKVKEEREQSQIPHQGQIGEVQRFNSQNQRQYIRVEKSNEQIYDVLINQNQHNDMIVSEQVELAIQSSQNDEEYDSVSSDNSQIYIFNTNSNEIQPLFMQNFGQQNLYDNSQQKKNYDKMMSIEESKDQGMNFGLKSSSKYEIESIKINQNSDFSSQLNSSIQPLIHVKPKIVEETPSEFKNILNENYLGSNNQINLDNGSLEESKHMSFNDNDHDKEEIESNYRFERQKKNKDKINNKNQSIMMGFDFDNSDSRVNDIQFQKNCGCKPSILVVDDNYYMRKPIVDMLKEFWNIEADQASDGDIAVEMFKNRLEKPCKCINRTYKLIFMDVQMERMDGIEACRQIIKLQKEQQVYNKPFQENQLSDQPIRQSRSLIAPQNQNSDKMEEVKLKLSYSEKINNYCKIVFQTAFQDIQTSQNCLRAGGAIVLSKPVLYPSLDEILQRFYY